MAGGPDPYQTLGVRPSASDAEVRAAYRRLVQLHHPDHNGGSAESARRFEEVQDAYARIRSLRQTAAGARHGTAGARGATGAAGARGATGAASGARSSGAARPEAGSGATERPVDPDLDARIAALEHELTAARAAREQAIRDARRAHDQAVRDAREAGEQAMRDVRSAGGAPRPTDEELGYITTDDSFSKILDDVASGAADEVSERLSQARRSPAAHRLADIIDEVASRLTGEPPKHP